MSLAVLTWHPLDVSKKCCKIRLRILWSCHTVNRDCDRGNWQIYIETVRVYSDNGKVQLGDQGKATILTPRTRLSGCEHFICLHAVVTAFIFEILFKYATKNILSCNSLDKFLGQKNYSIFTSYSLSDQEAALTMALRKDWDAVEKQALRRNHQEQRKRGPGEEQLRPKAVKRGKTGEK